MNGTSANSCKVGLDHPANSTFLPPLPEKLYHHALCPTFYSTNISSGRVGYLDLYPPLDNRRIGRQYI
jgi:hypothetical protein